MPANILLQCSHISVRQIVESRMCLIAVAYQVNDDYPLIVLANRDEFYSRPSAPLGEWEDWPGLFAGRDLQGGGTWMGMTRSGRFAAITNYRELPHSEFDSSRGHLVTGYLNGSSTNFEYLEQLKNTAEEYAGFNLLFGDAGELAYYSNKGKEQIPLPPGVYGLSNHLLDSPWPKVKRLKRSLSEAVRNPDQSKLQALLQNLEIAPDDDLPDTGLEPELERLLSSCFIQSENYGTRSSNLIMVSRDKNVLMWERRFGPNGLYLGERIEEFPVEATPGQQTER
jgi:uncharacterized protein with NRDE domain